MWMIGNTFGGVGGATIVGESDVSAELQRIAFGAAAIAGESSISATTNVIVQSNAVISSVSELSAQAFRYYDAVSTIPGTSSIIVAARLKWIEDPETPEDWTPIPDLSLIHI